MRLFALHVEIDVSVYNLKHNNENKCTCNWIQKWKKSM